jgi:hypothetical protein
MWFGLLAVAEFFYERKMGKENGNRHWAVFIVVVMVCV